MSRKFLVQVFTILFITIGLSLAVVQGQGIVKEGLTLSSEVLGKDVRYTVYLPNDYERSSRHYPVLYLLHGYSDDDTGWLQFGEANRIVDKAIEGGEIPPMIIVMPDGGVSFYINNVDGDKWEDMFLQEMMPKVESEYRIRTEKQYRGVAGLSMGGHGALILGLRNPDLFSSIASLSGAVITEESVLSMPQGRYDGMYGIMYGKGLEGKDRLNDHWKEHSILDIVESRTADELKKLRYWIDCGDDDFLAVGNSMLHIAMVKKQVPHEYRVRDGSHTWGYWRDGLPDALAFIGYSFRR